jgi:hypothetical protein
MILLPIFFGILVSVAPINNQWSPQAEDWDRAAKEVRRLSPRAFPNLPPEVVTELIRRNCTIPQANGYPKPHNVIKGSFAKKGQIDWAVLCSSNGNSSILVFWGSPAQNVYQHASSPDKDFLQGGGDGRIEYSRMISPVDGANIIRYYKEFGGPKPPPIDHQGIEDSFVGKASVILYYYRGRWLKLTGAD